MFQKPLLRNTCYHLDCERFQNEKHRKKNHGKITTFFHFFSWKVWIYPYFSQIFLIIQNSLRLSVEIFQCFLFFTKHSLKKGEKIKKQKKIGVGSDLAVFLIRTYCVYLLTVQLRAAPIHLPWPEKMDNVSKPIHVLTYFNLLHILSRKSKSLQEMHLVHMLYLPPYLPKSR